MKKYIVTLCFLSSGVIAHQYEAIPDNVGASDIAVGFSIPSSVDGALDTQVSYSVIANTYDEIIFKHYSRNLTGEWVLCSDQFEIQASNNEGLDFVWFNKVRNLSVSLYIQSDSSGGVSQVQFTQYFYRDAKQFNMEQGIACN